MSRQLGLPVHAARIACCLAAAAIVGLGPAAAAEVTGARRVRGLQLWTREDAERPEIVDALTGARGIFFAGGDQNRVTAALLGTPAFAAIRAAHRAGAVIGGTSAGTACMSERMITGDGNFEVIAAGAAVGGVRRGGPAAAPSGDAEGSDGAAPPRSPAGPVANLGARDVRLHVLLPGDRFDLRARRPL